MKDMEIKYIYIYRFLSWTQFCPYFGFCLLFSFQAKLSKCRIHFESTISGASLFRNVQIMGWYLSISNFSVGLGQEQCWWSMMPSQWRFPRWKGGWVLRSFISLGARQTSGNHGVKRWDRWAPRPIPETADTP